MHTTDHTAAQLFERANAAAADAIRYGGTGLAKVRRADASTLRAMARAKLRL